MNRELIKFKSSNNEDVITGYLYIPTGNIKGVVQIAHGMSEHFNRYKELIEFLYDKGYAVVGNDHLGHGNIDSKKGYMGKENGYIHMTKDLKRLTKCAKDIVPNKPYFLLGHSMGSFLCRIYGEKWGEELSGLILSGTGNLRTAERYLINFGILYTDMRRRWKGEESAANEIDKISKFFFNLPFKDKKSDNKTNWQTSDPLMVEDYFSDSLSGCVFTYAAYQDLFKMYKYVSRKKSAELINKDLPVYIFSGEDDPIGNFSKAPTTLCNLYKEAGIKDVTLKIYDGGRHEMLNEVNRKQVFEDVLGWIEDRV